MKKENFSKTWSGEISIEDFNTSVPNKKRINNQYEANNLEKSIKDNQLKKKKQKDYSSMTLEELRELRLISNTNGRPLSSLTDKKWQQEFEIRKLLSPVKKKSAKRLTGRYSNYSCVWNEETQGSYYGETNWQEYCSFINDVLKNIRNVGNIDYLYFIYQIDELLKFDFGENELKTKYYDGYWEVWLEKVI